MKTLHNPTRAACAAGLLLAAACAHTAQADEMAPPPRDPMQPPAAAQTALRSNNADSAPAPAPITPRHLMTIGGRRYLIEGGRRLGVGDMLGGARIERIDDGAVWLREAGELRQVSLFGGIVKRALPSTTNSTPSTGKRP